MTRYEEDEFDLAARERGPKGVHRPVQPRWKRLLPYIVVVALAPILAFAAISFLNKDNAPAAPDGTPSVAATDSAADPAADPAVDGEATADAETDPAAAPPEEPAPTEEPAPDVRYDATVVVLNGAGVQGIAGRAAERLVTAGFTSTQAENYNRAAPADSTVYYASADLADTAAAVGEALGITAIIEDSAAAQSIAVVLRGDYQE